MRIVKLSEQEFLSSSDVNYFFETTLFSRSERGKFRITAGRIRGDSFREGETLVFTYRTIVYYIGRSASALRTNTDGDRSKYPYFFIVDVDSLRQVEMTGLHDIERLVRKHSKKTKHLVNSQAWPQIDDSDISGKTWLFLEKRSHHLIGRIDEMDADSNDEDLKGSSLQSDFGGPSIAKQILCRRGQKRFRDALLKRYGCRCMISGCELMDVIEAAHIVPFKDAKTHNVTNGILLRSDLHTLFDLNLIGINPDTREVFLSNRVRGIEEYQQFHMQPLILNENVELSKKHLSLKWRKFREKHVLHE